MPSKVNKRVYLTKKNNLKQKGGAAAAAAAPVQNHVNYSSILADSFDKMVSAYKTEMQVKNSNVNGNENIPHRGIATNTLLYTNKFSDRDIQVLNGYKCSFYTYTNMYLWLLSSGMEPEKIIKVFEDQGTTAYFKDNVVNYTKILYKIINKGFSNDSPIVVFRCFDLFGSSNKEAKTSIQKYNEKLETMKPLETIEFNSFMSTSGVNPLHNETMFSSETNPTKFGYAVILIPSNTKFVLFTRENEILLNPGTLMKLDISSVNADSFDDKLKAITAKNTKHKIQHLGYFVYTPGINKKLEKFFNPDPDPASTVSTKSDNLAFMGTYPTECKLRIPPPFLAL